MEDSALPDLVTLDTAWPTQVVVTSLTAEPREDLEEPKPTLSVLPTFRASEVDSLFLQDGYLFLESRLDKILDGFSLNGLVVGRMVASHVHADALLSAERGPGADLPFAAPRIPESGPIRDDQGERLLPVPRGLQAVGKGLKRWAA
jgi:hypothetical protein